MTRLKNKLQRAIKEHSGSLLSNSSEIPEKKNFEYLIIKNDNSIFNHLYIFSRV
jgi:hypothetical protein